MWASADPILGIYLDGRSNGGVFDSFNLGLYTYVSNNPVRWTDPNGLCGEGLCIGALAGRVAWAGIGAAGRAYVKQVAKAALVESAAMLAAAGPDVVPPKDYTLPNGTTISLPAGAVAPATTMANAQEQDKDRAQAQSQARSRTREKRPFEMRLQLQTGTKNIDSMSLVKSSEPGVTKADAWAGLAALYQTNTNNDKRWNAALGSAVVNMSRKIKNIQGGVGVQLNVGNELRSDFRYNNKVYRIDLENWSGHNLKE